MQDEAMPKFNKPRWAQRLDAVNFTILGILLVLILWDTLSRLLGR